ncbi:MAG: vitamin K epoxide reductase family protein, partial [Patescibacteria group bacterium]
MINRLIFILSIAGLLVSGYLLERYISGGRIACGSDFGCDLVRQSAYSQFFGVPLPFFGLIFYFFILILSFVKTIRPIKLLNFILLTFSLIGLLVSLYLFYVEAALIHALCLWCTISGAISVMLFLLCLNFVINKKYYPFFISFVIFVIVSIISFKIPEEVVKNIVSEAGIFGPIILLLLIWLTNFFAPLVAGPFLFTGFYLYGSNVIVLSFIAANIAFISNFFVARIFGRKIVQKLAGEEIISKIDELSGRYGYKTLIFVRLLLSQQHDVISYASGLTNFSFQKYFIISF